MASSHTLPPMVQPLQRGISQDHGGGRRHFVLEPGTMVCNYSVCWSADFKLVMLGGI